MMHPDRFSQTKQKAEWDLANEMLKELNHAYGVLKDPVERSIYDRSMGGHSQSSYSSPPPQQSNPPPPKSPPRPQPEYTPPQRKSSFQLRKWIFAQLYRWEIAWIPLLLAIFIISLVIESPNDPAPSKPSNLGVTANHTPAKVTSTPTSDDLDERLRAVSAHQESPLPSPTETPLPTSEVYEADFQKWLAATPSLTELMNQQELHDLHQKWKASHLSNTLSIAQSSEPNASSTPIIPVLTPLSKPAAVSISVPPDYPEPANGYVFKNRFLKSGHGTLRVSNGCSSHAVMKLVDTCSNTAVYAGFVRANSDMNITGIPDGTYRLLFASGHGWDDIDGRFRLREGSSEFEDKFEYTTTPISRGDRSGYEFCTMSVTLNSVVGGTAHTEVISTTDFEKY